MAPADEVRALFDQALPLAPAARAALLAARCGDRPRLRAEVESLLAHAAAAGGSGFLDARRPPDAVGPHQLTERLGAGTFGEVWRGRQRQPFERTVAVKLLHPGIGAAALQRFGVERQALASLEHPGIAHMHEAGATADGRPWYAMELVDGPTITEHCRAGRVGVVERVRLMQQVCAAVHHAHERGIVHRDLKPSNVLVATIDGAPQPKVIDFGVAKLRALPGDDGADAWQTQAGQLVGTPAYMSPEQAAGEVERIDARTDVHALGVLLYELLTGTLPFAPDGDGDGSDAWRHRVREHEPTPPSERMLDRLRRDPAYRPPVLPRAVRGDLDAIVLRALAKAPSARYPSARALADDLQAVLLDRPVTAAGAGRGYRARKWLRRHRAVAVLAAAAAVAAAVGAYGTIDNLRRARQSEARLRTEADKLRAVSDFLRGMLGAADPERHPGDDLSVRDMLDSASLRVEGLAPEVETALRFTLGTSYRSLGRRRDSEVHLRRALDLADATAAPERGEIRCELGLLFVDAGRLSEAEGLIDEAVHLAETADDDLAVAVALDTRSLLYLQRGEFERAADEVRRAQARAPAATPPAVATALSIHLATALDRAGRYADAASALEQAAERARAEGRAGLPRLLQIDSQRLWILLRQAKPERALDLAGSSVLLAEQIYGKDHQEVGFHRGNLAEVLQASGHLDEAEAEFQRALDLLRRARPDGSIDEARVLGNLGWLLARKDRDAEAEPLIRSAIELRKRFLGAEHPDVATSLCDLARTLRARGAWTDAEAACREAVRIHRARSGDGHIGTATALHGLALALIGLDRTAEAAACLEETLRIAEQVLAPDHEHLSVFRRRLGQAYAALGRTGEARPLLEAAYEPMRARFGEQHVLAQAAARAMVDLAERAGDAALAEVWRARLAP